MITFKLFSATWCPPCNQVKTTIKSLESEHDIIKPEIIDIDQNQDQAREFSIRSIPTLVKINDGIEVERITGSSTKPKLLEFFTS